MRVSACHTVSGEPSAAEFALVYHNNYDRCMQHLGWLIVFMYFFVFFVFMFFQDLPDVFFLALDLYNFFQLKKL